MNFLSDYALFESLKFKKLPRKAGGSTDRYDVHLEDEVIGQVRWSSRMRGYAFQPPEEQTIEVKDFVGNVMAEWRRARKKLKDKNS